MRKILFTGNSTVTRQLLTHRRPPLNKIFLRCLHSCPRLVSEIGPLTSTSVADFHISTNKMETPIVFRCHTTDSSEISAIDKWFNREASSAKLNMDYFKEHQSLPFLYELISPQKDCHDRDIVSAFYDKLGQMSQIFQHHHPEWAHLGPTAKSQFFRFYAPLSLMVAAIEFNHQALYPIQGLYVAHNSISDLPLELRSDLPASTLVQAAGNGDMYGTSIWIGLEQTYTSLHRDPNPNIFLQMCSSKQLRLLPPSLGDALFYKVQMALGRQGNSRFRSYDMMYGPERDMLEDEVWNRAGDSFFETELQAGDGIFIPKGWWHSVRSSHKDGRLNASANWWFR